MKKPIGQIVNDFIGNSHNENLFMGNFAGEADYIKWLVNHELKDDYNDEDLQDLYENEYLEGYHLNEYRSEKMN